MLEIRLYHHEITQRERQLIRAAQTQNTITFLGRKYWPRSVTQVKEAGKTRTELYFEPVGVATRPQLALTPEQYKSLCGYPCSEAGARAYQKACREVWQRSGMKGDGEFTLKFPASTPPVLMIKEASHV